MDHHTDDLPLARRGDRTLARTDRGTTRGLDDLESKGLLLGGAGLVAFGLAKRSIGGLFLIGVGSGLVYQGLKSNELLSGEDWLAALLNTGATGSLDVERAITINRPVEEVWKFYRDFTNLPRFMSAVEWITVTDDGRSRWRVDVPKVNLSLEWSAEIVKEDPNELLVWRSVDGSEIHNEGYVAFRPTPDGTGCELRVRMIWRAPGGAVGRKVATFIRALPTQVVAEDLRRLKQILETGRIATIDGQTSGRDRIAQAGNPDFDEAAPTRPLPKQDRSMRVEAEVEEVIVVER